MRKSRFSDEQIIGIHKEHQAGLRPRSATPSAICNCQSGLEADPCACPDPHLPGAIRCWPSKNQKRSGGTESSRDLCQFFQFRDYFLHVYLSSRVAVEY